MTDDYEKQAQDFLDKTGTTFKAEFLKHGKHFEGDDATRDIYKITLGRGGRSWSFNFGQSVVHSGVYVGKYGFVRGMCFHTKAEAFKEWRNHSMPGIAFQGGIPKNPDFAEPTSYDVLACLTKYDPGTFEDFCGDFGYDTDSRKAERVYNAVLDEWVNVQILWSDSDLEVLREIA